MPNTLLDEYWSAKYKGLLRIDNDGGLIAEATIIDGLGVETPLKISPTVVTLASGSIKIGDNAVAISQDSVGGGLKLLSENGDMILEASTIGDVVKANRLEVTGALNLNGGITSENSSIVVSKKLDCALDLKTDNIEGSTGDILTVYRSEFSNDKIETNEIAIDTISGKTSATEVDIVGCKINGASFSVDTIDAVSASDVTIDDSVIISENLTIGTGLTVTAGTSALKATTATTITATGDVTVSGANGLKTDIISERSSATGVTIDGVLLKDSTLKAPDGIFVDDINESSTGTGITFNNIVNIEDGISSTTDTISIDVATVEFTGDIAVTGDITANKFDSTAVPAITSGTSAPSSTPSKVGDIYVDTSAGKLYFAVGASSSSDWIIVTSA